MSMKRALLLLMFVPLPLFTSACSDDANNGGSGGSGGSTSSSSTTSGNGGASSSSSTGSSSSSTTGSGMGGNMESGALAGITAAHNAVRAAVNPPAPSPIPPLEWAPDVAGVAQAYAEQCVFKHSGNSYGENIYATTGGATAQDVVDSWSSEVVDYDYTTNTCSGTCGHYTQVVWAKSLRLGCGMATCNKNSPFGGGSWEFWVCNYDPPGNYVGEKPY